MPIKKLTFKGSQGFDLTAQIDFPDNEPKAFGLFAHCFTCNKNLRAVGNINRSLNECGLAVMRFDFTGLGESAGDFADTNFSSNIDDLLLAAEFLAENYQAPKVLIGHSLGGAAVLQAAPKIDSVLAVATIGAPYDPGHVVHLFQDKQEEIEASGEATVLLAGRPFKIKKQFIDDLEETRMRSTISELQRALMIFHSPIDNTVGIDNAAQIFKAAKHPKSFVSLDKADHLLMDTADSTYVGRVAATWAEKYI